MSDSLSERRLEVTQSNTCYSQGSEVPLKSKNRVTRVLGEANTNGEKGVSSTIC